MKPFGFALWLLFTVVVAAGAAALPERAFADAGAQVAAPAAPSAKPAARPSDGAPRSKSVTDAVPCSACHDTVGWRSKGGSGAAPGFDHATTGFPLTGQHVRVSCVSCHESSRAIKRACISCHEDTHRGRLAASCDQCHVPAGWKVTRPLDIHRFTRFPLTGMHVLADCTECHRRASEHQFAGTPVDCFACHEQEYRRPNLRPVHTGSATSQPFPRDCSVCHKALAWVPAKLDPAFAATGATSAGLRVAPAGHDVRFPIGVGVHRSASCDDCHTNAASPRVVRCTGCHAHDPLRLAQQHKRPIVGDGAACLSCHPGGARR